LSVAQHVSAGRLRALAVTSARPLALAPGLPTVAESGLPGFEVGTIIGVFAPAATSRADVQEKFLSIGVEVTPGPPENLMALVKADTARFGKVIKDAGIGRK
jgi:tripartite-type tricarboxylate transporter receptor subunit TctC